MYKEMTLALICAATVAVAASDADGGGAELCHVDWLKLVAF